MRACADLFARYPTEMMDLCEREAVDDARAFCWWSSYEPGQQNDLCELCDRHHYSSGSDSFGPTCDSEECRRLYAWFHASKEEGGFRHREAFRKLFGKSWLPVVEHSMRREAILAAILRFEALEKERHAKNRRRATADAV